jgi:hypothetical protein
MIAKLAEILDPRSRRNYVGRHRAEVAARYVARVPVQHARPVIEATDTSP